MKQVISISIWILVGISTFCITYQNCTVSHNTTTEMCVYGWHSINNPQWVGTIVLPCTTSIGYQHVDQHGNPYIITEEYGSMYDVIHNTKNK